MFFLGEWLNGRAAVSKTAGCVFESRLPCQVALLSQGFFFCYKRFSTQPCVSLRIHVACDVRKSNASILAHYSVASLLAITSPLPSCLAFARLLFLLLRDSNICFYTSPKRWWRVVLRQTLRKRKGRSVLRRT